MPRNQCDKVMGAIFGAPWAILPEWLDLIIDVATGEYSDLALAASKREERAQLAPASHTGSVAVIPVIGPIVPRGGMFADVSGATSIEGITALLDEALNDKDVDAIVMNFDSPGGQVTGVHELSTYIRTASRTKPITAYVSGMAASAAYWLACACGNIVADRTAQVGSIGVISAWTDDSEARKKEGLKDYVFVSSQSPNKHLDPKTPAGRREIQNHVDALGAIFMGEVAKFRDVPVEMVENDFGQGSVLLADAALSVGMIDSVGNIETALTAGIGGQATTSLGGKPMAVANGGRPFAGGKKPRATDQDDEEDEEHEPAAETADPDDDDEEPSAETDEPEEDDEDDEARKKARAEMKAVYPDAYRVGFEAGFEAYRTRINSIRALGLVGHKTLIEKAIFEGAMTAGDVAIAHAKAEKNAREAMARGRLEESADANVPVASVPAAGLKADDAEKKAVIAAMAGVDAKSIG